MEPVIGTTYLPQTLDAPWGELSQTFGEGFIPMSFLEGGITTGDVSGDGRPDIVFGGGIGAPLVAHAFTDTGAAVPGWPVQLTGQLQASGIAIGHTDADTDLEAIIETLPLIPASEDVYVYNLSTTGKGVPPWPLGRRNRGHTSAIEVVRGDANDNGVVQCDDADFLLDFLFLGGPPPIQLKSADYNNDGQADISDPIAISNACQ